MAFPNLLKSPILTYTPSPSYIKRMAILEEARKKASQADREAEAEALRALQAARVLDSPLSSSRMKTLMLISKAWALPPKGNCTCRWSKKLLGILSSTLHPPLEDVGEKSPNLKSELD
jgi:hypothetical protein